MNFEEEKQRVFLESNHNLQQIHYFISIKSKCFLKNQMNIEIEHEAIFFP